MNKISADIVVTVLYNDEEFILRTYPGEYRNLMMLIYDRVYVEGFGDCGGMGRCATCMIQVMKSFLPLPGTDRNENATMKKAGVCGSDIRLSCQLMVDDSINNIVIKILQD